MKTLAIGLLSIASVAFGATTQPSIVLVHGAFADGSAWAKVIPILERDGFTVTAVQIPLTSLADDVAATKRALGLQKRPVVLVGHSYGGVVITGAADGNSNIKSLVYVAAFVPEANESVAAASSKFTAPALNASLVPDSGGFLYIDRAKFHETFCKDVPSAAARVMAATQKPVAGAVFEATVPAATWKNIPSWYIVSADDRAINPDLERFYARRAGAKTTELKTSHVPFLSQPEAVAKVIEEASK
jgi:pimeloyl-ACP methyl ester carboxylesterase